ncbi:TRAP transporter small permease [Marinobacter sp. GN3S48]|uniref:TRAP transporter small permease n=1 Tax=Marinobacter sp. GN3S48 TaxID=3382302 RepID=UPI00387B23B1
MIQIFLDRTARLFALAGGSILLLIVAMSIVSIVGRKLFSLPIPGDMELLKVGAAVAIAGFLPVCELQGYHLRAESFTSAAPRLIRRVLDAIAHLLCLFAAIVIAWRTGLQTMDNFEYGDQTTLLAIPLWIPLALIVPSFLLLALCSLNRFSHILMNSGEDT